MRTKSNKDDGHSSKNVKRLENNVSEPIINAKKLENNISEPIIIKQYDSTQSVAKKIEIENK